MLFDFKNKFQVLLWQALFLILGTSWLWATYLNPSLSYRASLISQYETPFQPYSWLFRASDIMAGILVMLAAHYYIAKTDKKLVGTMLAIIAAGLILDPILTTNCRLSGNVCHEYYSLNFVLHATETIVTAAVLFMIGIYDARVRRKVVSISFVLFQLVYGILFVSQLANQEHFNTVSQFIYQTVLIVWLAWFCRDFANEKDIQTRPEEPQVMRGLTATWAFFNGILAIIVSLAHLNLVGRIKGVYFTSDNAWLAQHGMIIGVVMIYLSRHLARGEQRARQIFLLIIGIEVIKYSVISPNAGLLLLYSVTFVALFLARDSFSRGNLPLTWRVRLKDLAYMLVGLLIATILTLLALDRDDRATITTKRALDNFFDYTFTSNPVPAHHLRSVLLANAISAFLLAAVASILWILFRPNKIGLKRRQNYELVRRLLEKYSQSSEDYFKLWPSDKNFFWNHDQTGFVAYKVVGSTAFGLADPIGANKTLLIKDFGDWCHSRSLKVCFLPVYESDLDIYKKAGLEPMQIGSSAEISIDDFRSSTVNDKWWRWKLNRAKKSGYAYAKSMPPHSKQLLRQCKKVSDSWLKIGGHAERGFALGYFDERYLLDCRIHYLTDAKGQMIAFTNELPQFNASQTITIDLLRYSAEAGDSMPFLLSSVIKDSATNRPEAKIFDLGFVPFAKSKGPLLAVAKALSSDRFSSKGLEQFKNKFNPDWRPNYMAYDGDLADLAVIALNIEKLMEQK